MGAYSYNSVSGQRPSHKSSPPYLLLDIQDTSNNWTFPPSLSGKRPWRGRLPLYLAHLYRSGQLYALMRSSTDPTHLDHFRQVHIDVLSGIAVSDSVVVNLGAWSARAYVAHLPEVVRAAER